MGLKSVLFIIQIFRFWSVRTSGFTSEVSEFLETSDCTCEGYNVTYQCTVIGGGFTIWKGSAFDCPAQNKITLSHTIRNGKCNDGKISGFILTTENNSYTSQLTVFVSSEMIGKTIGCYHDSSDNTIEIGSSNLTITKDSYPPPEDIRLVDANSSQLKFQWNSISTACSESAVHYRISTSGCGHCPIESNQTTATCTGIHVDDQVCKFSLQTMVCDNNDYFGNESIKVEVNLQVPSSPNVTVIPVYSHKSKKLSRLKTQFTKESFAISGGFDGSAISYIINYTDLAAGVVCASATVLASSCADDDMCEHDFRISFTPCVSSSEITVTVCGTNVLGEGLPSAPVSIRGTTNDFVDVFFDPSTKTVSCLFLKQQGYSKRSCSIVFGLHGDTCGKLTQQSSSSTNVSDRVIVPFPIGDNSQLESGRDYCFILTASNETFAVTIEGTLHTITGSDSVSGAQNLMIGIIPFAFTTGAMAIAVATIIIVFILITAILLKSRRVLLVNLEQMKAKQTEQSAIYEELNKVIPTPPSPTIDIEQNTAYISVPAFAR